MKIPPVRPAAKAPRPDQPDPERFTQYSKSLWPFLIYASGALLGTVWIMRLWRADAAWHRWLARGADTGAALLGYHQAGHPTPGESLHTRT